MNLFGAKPSEVKAMMSAEKTRRKAECRTRNLFFAEYDKLYYLQHYGKRSPGKIKGKKGIEAQANDATTQVNLMRQLIGVKDLNINVLPRWISEQELEAGSEVERWIWAVLEANNDRQEADVLDLVLFDAVRLGWGAVYSYWDQDVVKQSGMMASPQMMSQEMLTPEMMGMAQQYGGIPVITECPIIINHVSPYCIYPESGGHQGRWRSFFVIEEDKNAMEVAQEWGKEPEALRKAKLGSRHTVTVEYAVYWGWERIQDQWWVVNCVTADDEIIRQPTVMQGYDALPITLFFCHPTGDSRWEYMSLSSLFPIHLDVKLLDHLMSRLHKQVDQFTNLPLAHRKPRSGQGTSLKMMQGIFNVVELESDEALEHLKWQGNPPDFHILLNLERQKIQEGAFSSLAMGETIPVSGVAASRLWESNVVKLIEPTKAYTRGLKSLLNKIKALAVNFAGNIPISLITHYPQATGNVMLTGAQLEPYILSPDLEGELPMDQFRRLALGLQFAQLPPQLRPFSLRTLMERFLDIDQPEEEYAKMLQDMARQSKTVHLLQTYMYLLSQGMNIDIAMLAQIEGMAGGQPAGQQERQPREPTSMTVSPYEGGVSTLAETSFQEQAPGPPRPGFLEGAAAVPGGFAGVR